MSALATGDTSHSAEPALGEVGRRRLARLVAVAIPTALVAIHAGRFGHWIVDDAGLSFATARSLASGHGAALQAGAEPVETFSNPLWVALLVIGRWLRIFDSGSLNGVPDVVWFPKAIGLVCCAAMFDRMRAASAAIRPHRATLVTLVAGSITAAIPSFVIWTMSGLENSLYAAAVVALASVLVVAIVEDRLAERRVAVVCGALAAVAALTRPDGLIYLAAYPIALLATSGCARDTVRTAATSIGTGLVPLAIYQAWRLVEFGAWVANPSVAKQQGVPGLADLDKPTDLVAYVGWAASVVTIVAVVTAWHRQPTIRRPLLGLVVPLGLSVVAYTVLETDWMAQLRFATPFWPLLSLIAVVAIATALDGVDVGTQRIAAAGLAAVVLITGTQWNRRSSEFAAEPTVAMCAVARNTGFTFNTYADRLGIDDGTLLAVDGGGTALTSRLRFVDLSGLGDRRIARFWGDDDMEGLRDHVYDEVKPTFIRIWFGWSGIVPTGILDDPRLDRDYELVWGPVEGGGNYVRRDAVRDRRRLRQLQADAPDLVAVVDAPWSRGNTGWYCGTDLRPSRVGADPLTTIPT